MEIAVWKEYGGENRVDMHLRRTCNDSNGALSVKDLPRDNMERSTLLRVNRPSRRNIPVKEQRGSSRYISM